MEALRELGAAYAAAQPASRGQAGARAPPPEKNIEEHLLEIRLRFEKLRRPFIHCSGLRKLNNLWSIVTLGLETKRADTQPDGGI